MDILKGKESFYIGKSEARADAYIHYTLKSDTIIVADSTFVAAPLRGKGVAKYLLDRLADFARIEGFKIEPMCSFVTQAFEQNHHYDDINATQT